MTVTNESAQTVIIKPSNTNVSIADVESMEASVERIEQTILNLNTLGKVGDNMAKLLLTDALTLDADEVRKQLTSNNIKSNYAKQTVLRVKKLYGLMFSNNLKRDVYKDVILKGLAEGYTVSTITDIIWTLASNAHGRMAVTRSGLNASTRVIETKPSNLDLELLVKRYKNVRQDFYTGIISCFKLNLVKIDDKIETKISKLVYASVKDERADMLIKSNKLTQDQEALIFDKNEFKVEQEKATSDAITAEKDDQLAALMLEIAELKTSKDAMEVERDKYQTRTLDDVDTIEKLKDTHKKTLAISIEKTKDIYQSKAAKELEKVLEAAKDAKAKEARTKAALKTATKDANNSIPKPTKEDVSDRESELQQSLEHLLVREAEKDSQIANLEGLNLNMTEANIRQLNLIKAKDAELSKQYDPELNAAQIIAELVDAKKLLKDFKVEKPTSKDKAYLRGFKADLNKLFNRVTKLANKATTK
jgi:hypothetical protein